MDEFTILELHVDGPVLQFGQRGSGGDGSHTELGTDGGSVGPGRYSKLGAVVAIVAVFLAIRMLRGDDDEEPSIPEREEIEVRGD